MSIPTIIFLVIYGLFFLFFLILAIANFYNIIRFSFLKGPVVALSIIFLILIIGIVLGTMISLRDFDWNSSVNVNVPSVTLPI